MAVDVATTSKDVDVAKEKDRAKAKTRANERMVENRQKESRKEKLMPNNVEYAANMVIGHVSVQTESTKLSKFHNRVNNKCRCNLLQPLP